MCELTMRASLLEMPGAAEGRAEKDPKSARSGSRWKLTLCRAANTSREQPGPGQAGTFWPRLHEAPARSGWVSPLLSPPAQQTKLVLESFGESQMLVVGLLTEWFVGHHCDQLSVCLFRVLSDLTHMQ